MTGAWGSRPLLCGGYCRNATPLNGSHCKGPPDRQTASHKRARARQHLKEPAGTRKLPPRSEHGLQLCSLAECVGHKASGSDLLLTPNSPGSPPSTPGDLCKAGGGAGAAQGVGEAWPRKARKHHRKHRPDCSPWLCPVLKPPPPVLLSSRGTGGMAWGDILGQWLPPPFYKNRCQRGVMVHQTQV